MHIVVTQRSYLFQYRGSHCRKGRGGGRWEDSVHTVVTQPSYLFLQGATDVTGGGWGGGWGGGDALFGAWKIVGNNLPSTEQAAKTHPKQDKSFSLIFHRF